MRSLLLIVTAIAMSSCSLIYKLPTRQGNVIEQKQLDKLELGMSPEQVKFVMGTPLAASPFRNDRWDYVGYYRSPRGKESRRTVSLYFEGRQLIKMEGVDARGAAQSGENPDVATLTEQKKKDMQNSDAPQTGIVLQTDESTKKPRSSGPSR